MAYRTAANINEDSPDIPKKEYVPTAPIPIFLDSYWEEGPKVFFPASAVLSESSLQLPRIWVGYIALSYKSLRMQTF